MNTSHKSAEQSSLNHTVKIWWKALRPFTYTAAVVPVLLGSVLAASEGYWHWGFFLLALIGSIAIQAGTNLMNDYYDWKKGSDTPDSLESTRAMQVGGLTASQVFWGGVFCFALGSILGLYLVATRGLFILWIGIFSVLAGWLYTAGPWAFAYNAMGEIVVFIFMGPIMVIGSYYVLAQRVTWEAGLISLPIAMLVAVILHANNMRDFEKDIGNGKRTLANIFGRNGSRWEFYILVGGSYVSLLALVLLGVTHWLTLITLVTLPSAIHLMKEATIHEDPPDLAKVLRGTAQLHGRFGILMSLGICLTIIMQAFA